MNYQLSIFQIIFFKSFNFFIKRGFNPGQNTYQSPASDSNKVEVVIDPKSQRLQALKPFEPWDGKDFVTKKFFKTKNNFFLNRLICQF